MSDFDTIKHIKPEKPICTTCESDDVLLDAYVEWNADTQQFEVQNVMDKGHFCNTCGEERSVTWVPIEVSDVAAANAARCSHQDLEQRAEEYRRQADTKPITGDDDNGT